MAARSRFSTSTVLVVKTPMSNIRTTTFFAGESEAKIADPTRISEVQVVGREVDFAPPME